MSPRLPRQPRHSAPPDAPEAEATSSGGAKPLTVNVPVAVLNLAKTRASLEGTTMSAIVTDALRLYAAGLKDVLARLGLDKPAR